METVKWMLIFYLLSLVVCAAPAREAVFGKHGIGASLTDFAGLFTVFLSVRVVTMPEPDRLSCIVAIGAYPVLFIVALILEWLASKRHARRAARPLNRRKLEYGWETAFGKRKNSAPEGWAETYYPMYSGPGLWYGVMCHVPGSAFERQEVKNTLSLQDLDEVWFPRWYPAAYNGFTGYLLLMETPVAFPAAALEWEQAEYDEFIRRLVTGNDAPGKVTYEEFIQGIVNGDDATQADEANTRPDPTPPYIPLR